MLMGIIVVAAVILFIAAVWGREAAQGCFWAVAVVALIGVAALVFAVSYFLSPSSSSSPNAPAPAAPQSYSQSYVPPPSPPEPNYGALNLSDHRPTVVGIMQEQLAPATARMYGLTPGNGLYVRAVTPGGPADIAGIRAGDAILKADGFTASPGFDLNAIKEKLPVGAGMNIRVGRGGKVYKFTVILAPAP